MNINDIKELLRDKSLHIFMGQVKRLHIADDRSYLKAEVSVWPEERVILTEVSFPSTGPEAGFYSFPVVGDAVLCASAEGDVDSSFIISRLNSEEDKIPKTALDGSSVLKAISGKKTWITSNNKINLSKGDSQPSENLVLGQVFKSTYSDHLVKVTEILDEVIKFIDAFNAHTSIGNLGYPTGTPLNFGSTVPIKASLTALKDGINTIKSTKVENEAILSGLSFTEK